MSTSLSGPATPVAAAAPAAAAAGSILAGTPEADELMRSIAAALEADSDGSETGGGLDDSFSDNVSEEDESSMCDDSADRSRSSSVAASPIAPLPSTTGAVPPPTPPATHHHGAPPSASKAPAATPGPGCCIVLSPQPLEMEHWYISLTSIHNERLTSEHETASGSLSQKLVRDIAANNHLAKQRIRFERETSSIIARHIRSSSNSSNPAAVSTPLNSRRGSGGFQRRASDAGVPRTAPLPASLARRFIRPLCPTATQETDPGALAGDRTFALQVGRAAATNDRRGVQLLVHDYLFCTLRLLPGHPYWPGLSVSEPSGGDWGLSSGDPPLEAVDIAPLDAVRQLVAVAGSHSSGAKFSVMRETVRLLYASAVEAADSLLAAVQRGAATAPAAGEGAAVLLGGAPVRGAAPRERAFSSVSTGSIGDRGGSFLAAPQSGPGAGAAVARVASASAAVPLATGHRQQHHTSGAALTAAGAALLPEWAAAQAPFSRDRRFSSASSVTSMLDPEGTGGMPHQQPQQSHHHPPLPLPQLDYRHPPHHRPPTAGTGTAVQLQPSDRVYRDRGASVSSVASSVLSHGSSASQFARGIAAAAASAITAAADSDEGSSIGSGFARATGPSAPAGAADPSTRAGGLGGGGVKARSLRYGRASVDGSPATAEAAAALRLQRSMALQGSGSSSGSFAGNIAGSSAQTSTATPAAAAGTAPGDPRALPRSQSQYAGWPFGWGAAGTSSAAERQAAGANNSAAPRKGSLASGVAAAPPASVRRQSAADQLPPRVLPVGPAGGASPVSSPTAEPPPRQPSEQEGARCIGAIPYLNSIGASYGEGSRAEGAPTSVAAAQPQQASILIDTTSAVVVGGAGAAAAASGYPIPSASSAVFSATSPKAAPGAAADDAYEKSAAAAPAGIDFTSAAAAEGSTAGTTTTAAPLTRNRSDSCDSGALCFSGPGAAAAEGGAHPSSRRTSSVSALSSSLPFAAPCHLGRQQLQQLRAQQGQVQAALKALLGDMRTFSILFAQGVLVKYPFLSALPVHHLLRSTRHISARGAFSRVTVPSTPAAATAPLLPASAIAATPGAGSSASEFAALRSPAPVSRPTPQRFALSWDAGCWDTIAPPPRSHGYHASGAFASPAYYLDLQSRAASDAHLGGGLRSSFSPSSPLLAAATAAAAAAAPAQLTHQRTGPASGGSGSPLFLSHRHLTPSTATPPPPPTAVAAVAGAEASLGPPLATLDASKCVLRVVQEAMFTALHGCMLLPLLRSLSWEEDERWGACLRALGDAPPCVFGLGHEFCQQQQQQQQQAGGGGRPWCYGALAPGAALPPQKASSPSVRDELDPGAERGVQSAPVPFCSAAALGARAYGRSIRALRAMPLQRSPLAKAATLRACLACISLDSATAAAAAGAVAGVVHTSRAADVGNPRSPIPSAGSSASSSAPFAGVPALGADDLIPRLCFVLVAAEVPRLFSEIAYLEQCLPEEMALGEDGYAVVSLRGAAMHVLTLGPGTGAS